MICLLFAEKIGKKCKFLLLAESTLLLAETFLLLAETFLLLAETSLLLQKELARAGLSYVTAL